MSNPLPPKLYFRIGEVAGLVGVEPHVLRYWEREFRSIRPTKSAKGQRVYSRKDVEALLVVKDLLYAQGFTIAGAKKKLTRGPEAAPSLAALMADGAVPGIATASNAIATATPSAIATSIASNAISNLALSTSGTSSPTPLISPPSASLPEARTSTSPSLFRHRSNGDGAAKEDLVSLRSEVEAFLRELGG